MTPEPHAPAAGTQAEHCGHEYVCKFFAHDSKIAYQDGTSCMRNHEGCAKCVYDTRSSRPTPSAEQRIKDVIAELERRQTQAEVVFDSKGLYIVGLEGAISLLRGEGK